jgi:hypothetical protein
MSTIHIPPREGRHYPVIDGDHIAKAAIRLWLLAVGGLGLTWLRA